MKFLALLIWLKHRRRLKAEGYCFRSFCEMSVALWENPPVRSAPLNADVFSRREFRVRW